MRQVVLGETSDDYKNAYSSLIYHVQLFHTEHPAGSAKDYMATRKQLHRQLQQEVKQQLLAGSISEEERQELQQEMTDLQAVRFCERLTADGLFEEMAADGLQCIILNISTLTALAAGKDPKQLQLSSSISSALTAKLSSAGGKAFKEKHVIPLPPPPRSLTLFCFSAGNKSCFFRADTAPLSECAAAHPRRHQGCQQAGGQHGCSIWGMGWQGVQGDESSQQKQHAETRHSGAADQAHEAL